MLPSNRSAGWAPARQAPAPPTLPRCSIRKTQELNARRGASVSNTNFVCQDHTTHTRLPFAALFLMYSASLTRPSLAECLQSQADVSRTLSVTWWQVLDFNGSVLSSCKLVCFLSFWMRRHLWWWSKFSVVFPLHLSSYLFPLPMKRGAWTASCLPCHLFSKPGHLFFALSHGRMTKA